jgi:hypothetical protein
VQGTAVTNFDVQTIVITTSNQYKGTSFTRIWPIDTDSMRAMSLDGSAFAPLAAFLRSLNEDYAD